MLRKYCLESDKDWDEGVPLVLFAARETVQESLGFSPAELVFGHVVRGPLKVLKDQFRMKESDSKMSVLTNVSTFRERLHKACTLARETLLVSQTRMKQRYDQTAKTRTLQVGDQVLVLLPVSGHTLSARFSGPYEVHKKLSETDYVIHTPDRKRQSRVCHINMLKLDHSRNNTPHHDSTNMVKPTVVSAVPVKG